jgi:hypothetical protein
MHPTDMVGVLGGFGALLLLVLYLAIAAAGIMIPFAVLSLARSARRIARELARANDYREHYEHGARPGPLGT